MQLNSKLLAGAAAGTTLAGICLATPIVGLLTGTILSSGTITLPVHQHVSVPLPAAPGEDEAWEAKLTTSGPANFIVQDVVYAPGGHTGWHSHPGILLSSVIEGSIEWYDGQCNLHVYNAGDSLTESTALHYVRNVGTTDAHFMVTYVIAQGQPRRIDEPAPACAAGLGLT